MSILTNEYEIQKVNLNVPPFQDITDALSTGLTQYFAEVEVAIINCPDLTQNPFNLACKGLGGNPSVIQVGDPINFVKSDFKKYDFCDIPKALNLNSCYIFGAGGGFSKRHVPMIEINREKFENNSTYLFSKDKTLEGISVKTADTDDKSFSIVANLFASRGEPSQIIRISCKKRIGSVDFPTSIINSLNLKFSQPIALGTIFLLKKGKVKTHIAPEKLSKEIKNSSDLLNWFLLPIVEPVYVALGTILSRNPPEWNMTPFHFHGSNGKTGGHYHYDVTPEDVEYEAYLMPAEVLCAIDKAKTTISLLNYEL